MSPAHASTTSGSSPPSVPAQLPDRRTARAVLGGCLAIEPLQLRLLVDDDEVDVALAAQAVIGDRQQAVGVGRQVDARDRALLRHDRVHEARALVREPVVVVAPARRRQQVVERRHRRAPRPAVGTSRATSRAGSPSTRRSARTPRRSRTGRAGRSARSPRASPGSCARSAPPSRDPRARRDRRSRASAPGSSGSRPRTPRRAGSSWSRRGRPAETSSGSSRRCRAAARRARASTRERRCPARAPRRRSRASSGTSSGTKRRSPFACGFAPIRRSPTGASARNRPSSRPRSSNSSLGVIAAHPRLERRELRGIGAHGGERHLVRAERALDRQAVDHLRAGPALRRAQHDRRPARRTASVRRARASWIARICATQASSVVASARWTGAGSSPSTKCTS